MAQSAQRKEQAPRLPDEGVQHEDDAQGGSPRLRILASAERLRTRERNVSLERGGIRNACGDVRGELAQRGARMVRHNRSDDSHPRTHPQGVSQCPFRRQVNCRTSGCRSRTSVCCCASSGAVRRVLTRSSGRGNVYATS